jgi:hypothetical protein
MCCLLAVPAHATEGGASIYLLGSGVPNAAVQPPVKGVFVDNSVYVYDGSIGGNRDLVIGGKVVANVDATIFGNFTTLLVVPSTNFLGGTLALGVAVPIGGPMMNSQLVLTGPLGRELDITRRDSTLVVADPLANASLGWTSGKMHFALSSFVNIPIGRYNENGIANLSFHRWAGDISAAMSWHDVEKGLDVSGKVGVTFNGRNDVTDYNSGNDFHAELGVEKNLSKQFSAGVIGYYYQQISDDSGSGGKLGAFRGRVAAAGGTVAYNTILGRSPSTIRLRIMGEFDAKNRMQGTAYMVGITVPLKMVMPAGAGGQ